MALRKATIILSVLTGSAALAEKPVNTGDFAGFIFSVGSPGVAPTNSDLTKDIEQSFTLEIGKTYVFSVKSVDTAGKVIVALPPQTVVVPAIENDPPPTGSEYVHLKGMTIEWGE